MLYSQVSAEASSLTTMSVSQDHETPDLYCSEAASEVVSSDLDISNHESLWWEFDDESCVSNLFESELDQTQQSLEQLYKTTCLRTAREKAINWILKVHAYYRFRPETAYLSVNYLDRFLLSHKLPSDKVWPLNLLSVACLALAAKMEETRVPLLLDLQMIEPKFMFKPKTVQRMELLVMSSLKWQLRAITPFDFTQPFISKLSCSASPFGDCNRITSLVSEVIIRSCLAIDFLGYPPSTIAAAAVLWATNQSVDNQKLDCFHANLNKEVVTKCYILMKNSIGQSEHSVPKKLQPLPRSPTCVLDHAVIEENWKLQITSFDSKAG